MTQENIIGKTFYCTSQYCANLPFTVIGKYDADSVMVNTFEGRNSVTKKPIGRVRAVYKNDTVFELINTGIISYTKLKTIEITHQETREVHKFSVSNPNNLTPSEVAYIAKEMGNLKGLLVNGKYYTV